MAVLNFNPENMILEIPSGNEGSPVINVMPIHGIWDRNVKVGDMIGFCNIIAHMRVKYSNSTIKIYFDPKVIENRPHCAKFHDWMIRKTDYISIERGEYTLPMIDIWPYRFRVADVDFINIPNDQSCHKKICIFPIFDARYNSFRNWTIAGTQVMIDAFSGEQFQHYEKYFCSIIQPPQLNYRDFVISEDYHTNITHIMQCEYFIGGDTGTSHFAGTLNPSPPNLVYYLNKEKQDRLALPFHFRSKGGFLYY